MWLATLCIVLTGVGLMLSPRGPVWTAVANRLFVVTIIGFTSFLSRLRKQRQDDLKVLHGLLPICCYCKKIRDDEGYWQQIERYITARSDADFSHGLCPDCGRQHFPEAYSNKATKEGSAALLVRTMDGP